MKNRDLYQKTKFSEKMKTQKVYDLFKEVCHLNNKYSKKGG